MRTTLEFIVTGLLAWLANPLAGSRIRSSLEMESTELKLAAETGRPSAHRHRAAGGRLRMSAGRDAKYSATVAAICRNLSRVGGAISVLTSMTPPGRR